LEAESVGVKSTVKGGENMTTAKGNQRKHIEREFETGKDEAWFANVKRMYDEYQHESLESIRRNRSYVDKILLDAQQHDNVRQDIANQALQNAVETANMVGKQAVRHSDLAIDRQWNVDEQSYTAENILRQPFWQDLAQAIAVAVATALKEEE